MNREYALHPNAIGYAAHCEGLSEAATLAGNYNSFENLNALTSSLYDLDMHLNGVARFKNGDIFP
jgi:hypothetical protein